MSEQKHLQELEATVSHRFINLSAVMAQKAIGKNLVLENLWWTSSHLVVRCQFNFKVHENPMAKNKFVPGVNKFKAADQVIYKIAYLAKRPENKDKVFTVHHEDRFLGLIEAPVLHFLETSETPLHRVRLFKCDGEIIWDRKNRFTLI
mmetsp:Transcript_15245/g.20710  ORF Transcript_15245/g.20710 Transcript_15245/m.20710 type:complete len:148 (+) Transcript_15245:1841-2284(+)